MRGLILSIIFIMFLASCGEQIRTRTVEIYNNSGDMLGHAHLSEAEDAVDIKLKVTGFEPKDYSVHIHEIGKCKGPDFKSAGNHFNPKGKKHGLMNQDGAHVGDLPNVTADENGLIDAELTAQEATLLDKKNSLLNGDGTSIVISEEPDDGMTQPSGNSGQRIACGEIKQENKKEKQKRDPTDPTILEEEKKE